MFAVTENWNKVLQLHWSRVFNGIWNFYGKLFKTERKKMCTGLTYHLFGGPFLWRVETCKISVAWSSISQLIIFPLLCRKYLYRIFTSDPSEPCCRNSKESRRCKMQFWAGSTCLAGKFYRNKPPFFVNLPLLIIRKTLRNPMDD